MKLSTIEHNPSALKGFLNNPKWYSLGIKLKRFNACRSCKFTRAGLGCENPEQDSNPAFFLGDVNCYEPR